MSDEHEVIQKERHSHKEEIFINDYLYIREPQY